MSRITFCIVISICIASTFAIPSFLYPVEHRNDNRGIQVIPGSSQAYEYHLVPTDEYAVTEYYDPDEDSLWNYIPNPVTALTKVASKALKATKWVLTKGSLILFGVVLVLGFCGLTPFCTLTFEKYPRIQSGYRALLETNALDQIQGYVHQAIEKYKNFQNSHSD